ncbi:MAG: hypothetical protein PHE55_00440 [Methylococcaceae bacterium]|nr:hypothetical protein [Methylococcaceae bacterium]
MKNADNFNLSAGRKMVKNEMPTDPAFAVTLPNLAAIETLSGIISDLVEGLVQQSKIPIPLIPSPLVLSVAGNRLEIIQGFPRQDEPNPHTAPS